MHTALLTSLPFIVWGTLTFVGTAGSYICTELDTVMAGGQSDLLDFECPDQDDIAENLNGPLSSTNEATLTLNELLAGEAPDILSFSVLFFVLTRLSPHQARDEIMQRLCN